MADEKELVRSRIDIVDLIGQRVRLKKSGRNWTGLCPFHEDRNPSFSVSPEIGRYRCWSCGAAGDAFTWVMETQGLEFRDALELLAKQAGVELTRGKGQDKTKRQAQLDAMSTAQAFFREELSRSSRALEYCKGRELNDDVLAEWEIGYAPDVGEALVAELKKKGYRLADCAELNLLDGNEQLGYADRFKGRLMFPIRDDQGHLVAFGGRVIGDGTPKYINSSDTPLFSKGRTLYGMHKAKDTVRKDRKAVLVEGYLDVIACHHAGVTNAVATLGTAMSEHHVKRLALWCDEVTLLYDSDEAGQKAAERATELLTQGGLRVRVALMPKGEDPDTLLREQGPEAVQRAIRQGLEPIEFLLKQIESRHSVDSEEFWAEATRALASLSTPLEVERHLMPLAGRYPFMRDPVRAADALRRMVRAARKRPAAEAKSAEPVSAPTRHLTLPPPLEVAPFRALADPETRESAWLICLEEDLFITEPGRRLAVVARRLRDSVAGHEETFELVEAIEDDADRDLFAAVVMTQGAPLDEAALADVGERLARRRDEIRLRVSVSGGDKSDAELLSITARLKELKGEKPLEKSPEAGVDTQPDPFA